MEWANLFKEGRENQATLSREENCRATALKKPEINITWLERIVSIMPEEADLGWKQGWKPWSTPCKISWHAVYGSETLL